jgi:hypothetical protein
MRHNTKSLKANCGECEGILMAPLRLPRFFFCPFNSLFARLITAPNWKSAPDLNLAVLMASRQTLLHTTRRRANGKMAPNRVLTLQARELTPIAW